MTLLQGKFLCLPFLPRYSLVSVWCVTSGTTEKQGHRQEVCRARLKEPRTLSRTFANLTRLLKTHFFSSPKLEGHTPLLASNFNIPWYYCDKSPKTIYFLFCLQNDGWRVVLTNPRETGFHRERWV